MGPGVVESIIIDHNQQPQQRATEGVTMSSTSPRDQQRLVPTGSPAPLTAPTASADHGGEATHQWVPAGMGTPVDPDDINKWFSAPWASTATSMSQQELLSKAASLSFSSHISKSGEYDHQTSSVKQWINSYRNLRIRRPASITPAEMDNLMDSGTAPPAFQQPSQMQQVISTSSLKELQRQGTFTNSPKWTEGYVRASVEDAGDWVLGSIRPTRSTNRYNSEGNKITTASHLCHIHRDANFALTSTFYHASMMPEYGQHQPTADPAADAASATAGQPTSSGEAAAEAARTTEAAENQQRPFIKWCLINLVINEDIVNSMSDPATAAQHLTDHAFQPSRYNRRYTDYSIELVYDGSQDITKIDISHVFHIKAVWGSTMASPFLPDPSTWLASHLIDYSLVSSNIHVYVNSIMEIAQHPTIKNKLAYFCHNIFGKSIKSLLTSPSGEWIEYKGININLQHSLHLASKFVVVPSDSSGSSSDSEVEEAPSKKIKQAAPAANDSIQQGTIMHFNKGASVTINSNQEAISTRPNFKTIDIKDSK
eukprot:2613281-Amphidinium_carterae.1